MPVPTSTRPHRLAAGIAAAALLANACSSGGGSSPSPSPSPSASTRTTTTVAVPAVDPGDGGDYHPKIDPSDFVAMVDNPYDPLLPGSRWRYEGTSGAKAEAIEIAVLDRTRTVMGVTVTVVRDTVRDDGELIEDTIDWFAQDRTGNVWYFGEEVENYENGKVADTEGSWEAGVNGALPGIVMPAVPRKGDAHRQEFLEGVAEDMFEVLGTGGTTRLPGTTFEQVVTTEDWSPLEPELVEHKRYAPGVGLITEDDVAGGEDHLELVDHTPGRTR